MKRPIRNLCVALAMVIVVLLAVVFGRYPVTGIPAGTVKLEVRNAWDGEPILVLTREADVREARAIAGTVWAGILGGNSLDGPGRRLLISTSKDGQEKSDWITFTEWGGQCPHAGGISRSAEPEAGGADGET